MNGNAGQVTASRRRVFLVEDDPGVRRSLQLLLQGRGFDVSAYPAPDSILLDDTLDQAACLVADYRLDASDGIMLLRSLRARGWRGPAILVTGYATPELRRAAEEAGFGAFLEKPIRENALINTIRALMGMHTGIRP